MACSARKNVYNIVDRRDGNLVVHRGGSEEVHDVDEKTEQCGPVDAPIKS